MSARIPCSPVFAVPCIAPRRFVALQRRENFGDERHQLRLILESARATGGHVLDSPGTRVATGVRMGELNDEGAVGGETGRVFVRHAPVNSEA